MKAHAMVFFSFLKEKPMQCLARFLLSFILLLLLLFSFLICLNLHLFYKYLCKYLNAEVKLRGYISLRLQVTDPS